MKRHVIRLTASILIVSAIAVSGCSGPELTDTELGTVHDTIPKLKGDDQTVPFLRPPVSLPAVQPTGATLPVVAPTGTTLPAIAPTGVTLPAVQGT